MPVDLDPEDWDEFRAESHRALDTMIDYLRDLRERPVWHRAERRGEGSASTAIFRKKAAISPTCSRISTATSSRYATGNTHPLFMGWVQGAGTPVGMIAEMLAAGLNSNCGGRNHIAIDVERQIAAWMAQAFGFPPDASGVFVTGTSIANFLSPAGRARPCLWRQECAAQRALRDSGPAHRLCVARSA